MWNKKFLFGYIDMKDYKSKTESVQGHTLPKTTPEPENLNEEIKEAEPLIIKDYREGDEE